MLTNFNFEDDNVSYGKNIGSDDSKEEVLEGDDHDILDFRKCDICEKWFLIKDNFNEHKETHHEKINFICKHCKNENNEKEIFQKSESILLKNDLSKQINHLKLLVKNEVIIHHEFFDKANEQVEDSSDENNIYYVNNEEITYESIEDLKIELYCVKIVKILKFGKLDKYEAYLFNMQHKIFQVF